MHDFSTHPLVETAWLAAHLSDDDVRIVDARGLGDGASRELFKRGHIPGAIHLDWYHDLSWTDARGVRNLLLPPESFAAVMEAAGIGDHTRVVVYAETDHSGATRLWWALRYYGHDQVTVLNGGWTRWVAEGLPVSTKAPRLSPKKFTPRPLPQLLATATEITHVLREKNILVRLVDTRPAEQFKGQAIWTPNGSLFLPSGQYWIALPDQRMIRGGHIPGAVHLHATHFLNPADWTYLPPESLRSLAAGAGLDSGQRVITYCGVGISASQGLFALHLAG